MNTVSKTAANSAAPTPLAHLFSYIQDLFHTGEPILDFQAQQTPYWQLAELLDWAKKSSEDVLTTQYQDISQPFLSIQKDESEAVEIPIELEEWVSIDESAKGPASLHIHQERVRNFDDDNDRNLAFEEFSGKVAGKPVQAVLKEKIPPILQGWLDLQLAGEKVIVRKKNRVESLHEDGHRVQMLDMFRRVFQEKASANWQALQINRLYERLHTLFYELKSQPQTQLYFSFGLVSGIIGGKKYQNFLFHVPLSVQLSQQTLSISADPLAYPVNCEQTFTQLLAAHFSKDSQAAIEQKEREVIQAVEAFNHRAIALSLSPEYVSQHFHQTAIDILRVFPNLEDNFFGEKGWKLPDEQQMAGSTEIFLSFSPVFQMRKEEPRLHISRDAGKIVEKLQQTDSKDQIPDFFQKLFSLRSPSNPFRVVHKKEESTAAPQKLPEFIGNPQPVLFPLPYNEEQRAIVYRLEKEDAVTVQGPPGTGKSHTIANIMSHYAALGKSVLIVSKYGKALDVIKNKLPESLKHLVLSWVESDQQHEQLKYAIDAIKEQLSRKYSQSEIESLEHTLENIDTRYSEIQSQLEQLLKPDSSTLTYDNPFSGKRETRRGSEWARWSFEHPHDQAFIQEPFSQLPEDTTELAGQIATYLEVSARVNGQSMRYIGLEMPNPETWLKVEQLIHYSGRLNELAEKIDLKAYESHDLSKLSDLFSERWEEMQPHLVSLRKYRNLRQSVNFSFSELGLFLAQHKDLIEAHLRNFWDHEFDLTPVQELEPEQLLEEVLNLREKFGENEKLSLLKRNTLPKIQKRLLACQVDRLPLDKLTQVDILVPYVEQLCKEKKLEILFRNYFQKMGWEFDPEQMNRYVKELNALQAAQVGSTRFNAFVESQGLPPLDFIQGDIDSQAQFYASLANVKTYREVKAAFETCLYPLRQSQGLDIPLIHDLQRTAEQFDVEAYKEYLEEYETFRLQVEEARISKELGTQIKALLPDTFQLLAQKLRDREETPLPHVEEVKKQVEQDLFHLTLMADLKQLVSPLSHTSKTFEELEQLKSKREEVVAELILHKTWYHKSTSLTDGQRAALTAWRNDIINIGKGHGKNADRNLSSAIQNMRKAKSVVPIWIMQQDTAIKFFADPEPGQFDLLIIDEASQCDISMVNLIFRAKKCMIVGDENQTAASIPSTLFPIERTNRILDRYLDHHPFKEQFNINNRASSIYSLSGVIYPNIVTLLEHFRCSPEIIGYSNRYVYNKQMIPLKTATENHLGEPLIAEYVEEESLKKKRIHIVDRVKFHIEGLIEKHEAGEIPKIPTVGVLTLDSSNEAHLDQLIRVLSASKPIRKHADELDLLIGTARKFQGDERDVMIMTSTAIHRKNAKGSLKPPRALLSEEMMRIYNVAASRAREKSILLHCVAQEAVATMNPNCYRKKLIDYYTDSRLLESKKPTELGDILKKLPKEKEALYREVCIFLFEKGYGKFVHPNYKLGHYQLDVALLNEGKKVAILFDTAPKKDATSRFNELITLKRVGWEFFYLPEMLWFYDSAEIQKRLSNWLGETLASNKEP